MELTDTDNQTWLFRKVPPDGGRDFGNSGFEAFKHSIDTFTREVIQNSLDATVDPAKGLQLKFRLIRLKGEDLKRFQEIIQWSKLHDHIRAAATGAAKQRIGHRLKQGLEQVQEEKFLDWLIVEEYGTTGLVGPEVGVGSFAALCRNNFDSHQKNTSAGGSFGLGKAALWIASRVSTVLFSSSVKQSYLPSGKSNPRVFGRTELVWHQYDQSDYAGPGWFGLPNESTNQVFSSWKDHKWLKEIGLDRPVGSTGTSIGIVGFHDADSESTPSAEVLLEKLATSASQWYFPVMTDQRLTVTIERYESLKTLANRTPEYSKTIDPSLTLAPWVSSLLKLSSGSVQSEIRLPGDTVVRNVLLKIPPLKESPPRTLELCHQAKLLVTKLAPNNRILNGQTIGMLRGRGMIVQYRDPRSNLLTSSSYIAILLAGTAVGSTPEDIAAEAFLRIAEPPAHDRWDGDGSDLLIHYKKGGKKYLGDFQLAVTQALKSILETPQAFADDAPKILRNLFPFGNETPGKIDRPSPRIQELKGHIDSEGRWEIIAKLKLKTSKSSRRFRPLLQFDADSGKSQNVQWESLSIVLPKSVMIEDGQILIVPPKVATIQLIGVTDASTHPVPAKLARVSLVLKPAEADQADELIQESPSENDQLEISFN